MAGKKYKLLKTDTKKSSEGKTLFRIQALAGFSIFKKGEKGGYIEKEANLSQDGDAWVYGNARVYGNAWVSGRFDLKVSCDVKIPRVLIDTKEKLNKLLKVMNELKGV